MKKTSNHPERRKYYFTILLFVLVIAFLLGIVLGSVKIPLQEVLAAIVRKDTTSKTAFIVWNVRLPRVCAGVLAGVGLGVAGVIIQGVMNNSLASPNTIGVNSGAGFFAMIAMIVFPQNILMKSVLAFLGAFFTALVILALAYVADRSRMTIVLAGITVSSFLSAGMNVMKILDTDLTVNSMQFVIGSLSGVTFNAIAYPAIGIAVSLLAALVISKGLNLLSLGDGVANSLGLRVNLIRIVFVVISSVMAGAVVSFAGMIGFVGLIVPHICRYFFGHDARVLIPASALMGGSFVVICDILGRVLFAPYELPAGIILSLTGAPFFLYLLLRRGGRRVNA